MNIEQEYKSVQEWREAFFPEASKKEKERFCFENPEFFVESLVKRLALSTQGKKKARKKIPTKDGSR
jgi:hypothetical protein